MIPIEWDAVDLQTIAGLRKNKYNPKEEVEDCDYIGLEHIIQNQGTIKGVESSLDTSSIKNKFLKNDVLFSKIRPYLRKYWLAEFNGVCSTEILPLYAKDGVIPNYLFYIMQKESLINELSSKTFGTKCQEHLGMILKHF